MSTGMSCMLPWITVDPRWPSSENWREISSVVLIWLSTWLGPNTD